MYIYLVRHGESEGNLAQFTQTSTTPLSSNGEKQIKLLAKRFRKIKIDFIYSSHIQRAKHTAEAISKVTKIPIKLLEDLQEMRSPTEIQGLAKDHKNNKRIRDLIKDNHYKGNWKYSDEETFDELKNRCQNVLNNLFNKHKNQNILCVTHGGVIRMIVCLAVFGESTSPNLFWEFWHHSKQENTGITIIEHTNKYGFVLSSWNDTTHL